VTDSGTFTVTPVTTVPGSSLVAISAAVYRTSAPIATVAQRRAAVIGYISTTFDVTSLIDSVAAAHGTLASRSTTATPAARCN